MARINFIPSQTGVEVREPDGDVGSFPAASPKSAGVMTAQHVRMLDEVFQWFRTHAGDSAPVVIERHADMSQYPTRTEVKALLQAMPRALDMGPQVQALRGELMALHQEMAGAAKGLLAAPPVSTDVVDQTARAVLDTVLVQFESLDQRLRHVEGVIDALRMVAEIKGQEAA